MFLQTADSKRGGLWLGIGLGLLGAASSWAQSTIPPENPVAAYSTIGVTYGETLRVDVVNLIDPSTVPPGPCNVQMGFVNAAGVSIKNKTATIPAGHSAFLTLTFAEASPSTTAADSRTRVNIRPVVNTVPPDPCRIVSSTELFDPFLGRTHAYAIPAETPTNTTPPGPPVFSVVGITALDVLRLNVTNITGSNGIPPGPCSVQMSFVNAAGDVVKTFGGTIDAGRTAFLTVNYYEAVGTSSTNSLVRANIRPLVGIPPGPCAAASAELVDALTGITMVSIPSAFPTPWAPAVVGTFGQ